MPPVNRSRWDAEQKERVPVVKVRDHSRRTGTGSLPGSDVRSL